VRPIIGNEIVTPHIKIVGTVKAVLYLTVYCDMFRSSLIGRLYGGDY